MDVLVAIFTALINTWKTREGVYVQWVVSWRDLVHNRGEGMIAGAGAPYYVASESGSRERWMLVPAGFLLFTQFGISAWELVPTAFKLGLSPSVNLLWKHPCKCFWGASTSAQLTVSINQHNKGKSIHNQSVRKVAHWDRSEMTPEGGQRKRGKAWSHDPTLLFHCCSFIIYGCLLYACLCTTCLPGSWRGQRKHPVPRNWSYRQLYVTMKCLKLDPGPLDE